MTIAMLPCNSSYRTGDALLNSSLPCGHLHVCGQACPYLCQPLDKSGHGPAPRAELTSEERTRRIHVLYVWATRLTGNIFTTPGSLPSSTGGVPVSLLRAIMNNAEARLQLLSMLPEELRAHLNERSLSSDVVELVFAVIHGKLGSNFDMPTLLGSLASVSFVLRLAAMPEERRGFAMGPVSKSYACHSEASNAAAWNDGSALRGGARQGRHLARLATRALRKARATAQAAPVRAYHKNMGA